MVAVYSVVVGLYTSQLEETTIEVPCYDQHNNVIKSLICEDSTPTIGIFLASIFVITLVVGLGLLLFSVLRIMTLEYESDESDDEIWERELQKLNRRERIEKAKEKDGGIIR